MLAIAGSWDLKMTKFFKKTVVKRHTSTKGIEVKKALFNNRLYKAKLKKNANGVGEKK